MDEGTKETLPAPSPLPAPSQHPSQHPSQRINAAGVAQALDVCYIQLGKFSFEQSWADQKVSRLVTLTVLLLAVALGMLVGWSCGFLTGKAAACRS